MMKSITALLSLAVLFTGITFAQAEEHQRVVQVTGTAVAKVKPDVVVWNIHLTHTDPDLTLARELSEAALEKLLAMRGEFKIDASDVQTQYMRINKIYQRDRSGNQGAFRHYAISRYVTMRQRDLEIFDDVLQKLTAVENIEVSHSLESSSFHDIRRETRLRAVKIAREKAQEMTELLGARLGPVMNINETQNPGYWAASPVSNAMYSMGEPATPDEVQGGFAPGAIEIRVSIDVAFAIE